MLADGCVVELGDPEHGRVRQVGRVYALSACPATIGQPAPSASAAPTGAPGGPTGASLGSPLEGVRVIDLGLAVAGPFGAQMLGDLGADVVRVSQTGENPLIANQIQLLCNRNKRSIALDLKNPEGLAVLLRLVEQADVVHSNM